MNFSEIIALIFILGLLVGIYVFLGIDLRKQWNQRKRDELRRQKFIDNVSVISAYFFYKGLSEGFEMGRSIDDIVQERLEHDKIYK